MENLAGPGNAKLRPIRRKDLAFLARELEYWRELKLLDDGQAASIPALYEPVKERFLQVFMGLGALLVGLGLLSYVAANWVDLSRVLKVALIVGAYILSILAAFGFESSYPHTSRAFLLIGSFAYGGGIFLIAQIFHEGGAITDALFWWMAGLAPVCLLFKDRIQLLLIQAIALAYFNWLDQGWWWLFENYGRGFAFELWPFSIFAGLWIIWWRIGCSRAALHMNIFIALNLFGIYASRYCRDITLLWVLFFTVGLFLCAAPLGRLKDVLEGWGVALTGAFGLALSFPDVWRWSKIMVHFNAAPHMVFAVAAAILACAALLWCIHKGSMLAMTFFCLLILRYYFDVFYDFMDKALFFTTGGLLLMAMGFYLQRARKKRPAKAAEKRVRS